MECPGLGFYSLFIKAAPSGLIFQYSTLKLFNRGIDSTLQKRIVWIFCICRACFDHLFLKFKFSCFTLLVNMDTAKRTNHLHCPTQVIHYHNRPILLFWFLCLSFVVANCLYKLIHKSLFHCSSCRCRKKASKFQATLSFQNHCARNDQSYCFNLHNRNNRKKHLKVLKQKD